MIINAFRAVSMNPFQLTRLKFVHNAATVFYAIRKNVLQQIFNKYVSIIPCLHFFFKALELQCFTRKT